jgi:hypothetical protein
MNITEKTALVDGRHFTLRANAAETTLALQRHDPSMDFGDAQELALKLHSGGLVARREQHDADRQRQLEVQGAGALRVAERYGLDISEASVVAREVQARGGNGTHFDQALARLLSEKVPVFQALARARAAADSRGIAPKPRLSTSDLTLKLMDLDPSLDFSDAQTLALRLSNRPGGTESGLAQATLLAKNSPRVGLLTLLRG